MTIRRPFVVLARNILLLALLGCLAACQMPFGMGQRAPEPKPQPVAPAPATGPCVVLALPSSGTYAAIAGKVRHGAQMAQNELAANGVKLRLETINTEAPDWLQRLDALPQACTVVGGPLQARNYAQAREHGQLEKRAFFTFVPSLEQGDEGARAWRFFPSPQDQIDTLIGFATTGMNIRTYGAFYPTDAYGVRMTGLMEQSLASQNMLLQKASYNPADPTSWSDAVAPLINAQTPQGSKTPVPQTSFEALFLPDSWKSMEMLTTSLLYNGEDRLVLLGTTLWEQSLSGKTISNADKYALAVFPAAWNQPQAPRALQVPGTDFWNALGYDFVRFAVSMGLDSRLTTPQVTARAQRASKNDLGHGAHFVGQRWRGSPKALFVWRVTHRHDSGEYRDLPADPRTRAAAVCLAHAGPAACGRHGRASCGPCRRGGSRPRRAAGSDAAVRAHNEQHAPPLV